jgi:hypothetical protein
MIEGLKSFGTKTSSASFPDRETESAALAGAAAIQRLLVERRTLREKVRAHQRELAALGSANEDLRRQFSRARKQYIRLAREFLEELKSIDLTIDDVVRHADGTSCAENDNTLISLAQQLSPSRES